MDDTHDYEQSIKNLRFLITKADYVLRVGTTNNILSAIEILDRLNDSLTQVLKAEEEVLRERLGQMPG